MQYQESEFNGRDARILRAREWRPDGTAKAAVCLVHGLGDHSGRYAHLAELFCQEDYVFSCFDLRGHGLSEGRRGHARSFSELAYDLDTFLHAVSVRNPGLPRFLYGHSLGGSIAVYYTLKQAPELEGVIATSPLFRLAYTPPQWKTILLKMLHALRINLSLASGIESAALSRDIEVVRRYRDDPLVHDRISPSLAHGMLQAGAWNLAHADSFPLPLLLMHGSADRITSAAGSIEFAERMGPRCTLKLRDGFYHEMHNEPEWREVAGDILNWMASLCPNRT